MPNENKPRTLRETLDLAVRWAAILSLLNPGPFFAASVSAAEFEVVDRLTVDGFTTLKSSTVYHGIAAPPVSAASQGVFYFDSATKKFRVSEDGASYADLMSANVWSRTAGVISPNTGTDKVLIGPLAVGNAMLSVSTTASSAASALFISSITGRVGISTNAPQALLHVSGDVRTSTLTVENGALLVVGAAGGIPATGAGTRLMWVPELGAIRAGTVSGDAWDVLGANSAAFGADTQAQGDYSFSAGQRAKATAQGSFVWADSQAADLVGSTTDQFLVRAQGGFQVDASSFAFNDAGVSRLYVDTAGNVGVGTSVPASTMTVQGHIRIAGAGNTLIFPDGSTMNSANTLNVTALSNVLNGVITADSDANGTGDIIFNTGNVEKARMTNAGNLGIGTASPAEALHVVGGGRFQRTAGAVALQGINADSPANDGFANSPAARFTGIYDSASGGGVTRAEYSSDILLTMTAGLSAPAGRLGFFAPAGTERVSILTNNGYTGIGLLAPQTTLDVGGMYGVSGSTVITSTRTFVSADGAALTPAYSFASDGSMGLFKPVANVLGFSTQGAERMRLDSTGATVSGAMSITGNYKINGVDVLTSNRLYQAADGAVGGPGFSFATENNMGMYRINANVLGFATGGSLRGQFDTTGLSVTGNINTTGSFMISGVPVLTATRLYQANDGTVAGPGFGFVNETNMGLWRIGANTLGVTTGGTERARFDANGLSVTGNVNFSGGLQVGGVQIISSGRLVQALGGSASAPSYAFSTETNSGLYLQGGGVLSLATAGVDRFLLSSSGLDLKTGDYLMQAQPVLTVVNSNRTLRTDYGTASVPAISFYNDNDLGLYRSGANTMNFAAGGVNIAQIDANGLTMAGSANVVIPSGYLSVGGQQVVTAGRLFQAADGLVNTPAFFFQAETNTGMYRQAANTLRFSVAGSDRGSFDATGFQVMSNNLNVVGGDLQFAGVQTITNARLMRGGDGAVGGPTYSFSAETNSGLFRAASGILALATQGAERVRFDSTGLNLVTGGLLVGGNQVIGSDRIIRPADGSAAAPAFSFFSDNNTGIWRSAAQTMSLVTGGSERGKFDSNGLTVTGNANVTSGNYMVAGSSVITSSRLFWGADGTAAAPVYSFFTEQSMGLYRAAAGQLGFATAGAQRGYFDSNGLSVSGSIDASASIKIGGTVVLNANRYYIAANGAAATPSFTFSTDQTMGMYYAAANTLGFAVQGVQRGYFDVNGFTVTSPYNLYVPGGFVAVGGQQVVTSDRRFWAQDGAATTPGLSFQAEPGTGLWRPAGSVIAFSGAGTELMRLTSTGLGVGTNSPQAKLHVLGVERVEGSQNTMVQNYYTPNTVADQGVLNSPIERFSAWYDANATGGTLSATQYDADTQLIMTQFGPQKIGRLAWSLGGSEYMTIRSDAKLGVGTANPMTNLDVAGSYGVSGSTVVTSTRTFWGADGAANSPAYSFLNDGTMGMYRAGANQLGFAINTVQKGYFDVNGFNVTGNLAASGSLSVGGVQIMTSNRYFWAGDGAAANPSYTFYNDQDTGMYYPASANNLYFATGGSDRLRIDPSGNVNLVTGELQIGSNQVISSARLIRINDGAVGAPSYSFASDNDTGLYWPAIANNMSFTTGGVERMRLDSNGNLNLFGGDLVIGGVSVLTSTRIYRIADGTPTVPGLGFFSEANTGIYRPQAQTLSVVISGTDRAKVDTSGLTVTGNAVLTGGLSVASVPTISAVTRLVTAGDGAVGTPAYSFTSDADTGLYWPAVANAMSFATGATERMRIDSSGRVGIAMTGPAINYSNLPAVLSASGGAGTTARLEANPNVISLHHVNPSTITAGGFQNSPIERFEGLYDPAGTVTREMNADLQTVVTAAGAAPLARFAVSIPSGQERVSVMNTGLVGINTTNPAGRLDVGGNYAVSGSTVITSTGTFWAVAGAAATPAYTFQADPSMGLYRPAANAMGFTGFATERMRLDHTQVSNTMTFLGLNMTVPSAVIHPRNNDAVNNAVTDILRLEHDTTGAPASGSFGTGLAFSGENSTTENQDMGRIDAVWADAAAATQSSMMRFSTRYNNGALTPQVWISSQGHVGLGTSAPNPQGYTGLSLTISPLTAHTSAALDLQASYGTMDGVLGSMNFRNTALAAVGDNMSARIEGRRDGANNQGALVFYTRNGAGVPLERMRIKYDGSVGIGQSAPTNVGGLHVGPAGIKFNDGTTITTYSGAGGATGISNAADADILADNNSDGTGQITLRTAATTRMTVVNTGHVGIQTGSPMAILHARSTDTVTNAVTNVLRLEHDYTGGGSSAGFGTGVLLAGKTSATANRDMAQLDAVWTDSTDATRSSALRFSTLNNGGAMTEQMRVTADGKVGVGTTNPGTLKLAVSGDLGVAPGSGGKIYFSDGTFLTTAAGGSAAAASNAADLLLQSDSGALGTGDILFKTGSTERMRLENSGEFGLGTSAPAAKLHLSSGTLLVDGNAAMPLQVGVSTLVATLSGNIGIGTSVPTAKLHVSSGGLVLDGNAATPLQIGVSTLVVTLAGNVGIGTSSPKYGLDVSTGLIVRSSMTFDGMAAPPVSVAGDGALYFDSTLNKFRMSENGAAYVNLDDGWNEDTAQNTVVVANTARNVGIGTSVPAGKLHLSSGTLLIDGNTANSLQVGVSTLVVKLDGKVGIGTAVPTSTLTVAGLIETTGGGIKFADGTILNSAGGASASAITNVLNGIITADSDQNGSGNVILRTGSTDRVTLTNGGLMGVGTASPAEALHVVGGARLQRSAGALSANHYNADSPLDNNTLNSPYERFTGVYDSNAGAGVTRAEHNADVQLTMTGAGANPAGRLSFFVPTGSERVSILSANGYVGIGLQTPTAMLDVAGHYGVSGSTVITSTRTFWGADGAAQTPTYSFTTDGSMGMFKPAASTLGFATQGAERMRLDNTGALVTGYVNTTGGFRVNGVTVLDNSGYYRSNDGLISNAGFGFANETNTGMYRPGGGIMGFTVAGTERGRFDANGLTVTGLVNATGDIRINGTTVLNASRLFQGANGSAAAPAFAFSSDGSGAGMYLPAGGAVAFSSLGVERGRFDATGLSVTGNTTLTGNLQIGGNTVITSGRLLLALGGSAAAPSYAIASETNTGLYLQAAGTLSLATVGADRLLVSATGADLKTGDYKVQGNSVLTSNRYLWAGDGLVGTPSVSFFSDQDTGLYSGGANIMALTTGGVERARADTTGFVVSNTGNMNVNNGAYQIGGNTVITSGRLIDTLDGIVSSPAYGFSNETNTGMYRQAASTLRFTVAGSDRGSFDATGFQVMSNHLNIVSGDLQMGGVQTITGTTRLMRGGDGAVGTPTFSFFTETNSGLYKPAGGVLALTTQGADRVRVDSTGLNLVSGDFMVAGSTVVSSGRLVRTLDGLATFPAYSFHGDNYTGMYRPAWATLGFATGQTQRGQFDSTGFTVTGSGNLYVPGGFVSVGGQPVITNARFLQTADGLVGTPAFTFLNDPDTGLYSSAANTLAFTTGGGQRGYFDANGMTVSGDVNVSGNFKIGGNVVLSSNRYYLAANGAAATPGFSFLGEQTMGMYWVAAGQLGFATGSTQRAQLDSNGFTVSGAGNLYVPGGNIQVAGAQVVTADRRFWGQDGAVGTPSLSFASEATTGLWRPGNGVIGFASSGTELMRMNSTGLGVGTNNPQTKLHTANGTARFEGTQNSLVANYYTPNTITDNTVLNSPVMRFSAWYDANVTATVTPTEFAGDQQILMTQYGPQRVGRLAWSLGGSEYMTLRSDSKLGIGTSNPMTNLDVVGTYGVSGSTVVTSTGTFQAASDGVVATPAYSFKNDGTMGFYRSNINQLSVGIAGTQRGYFDANGLYVNGNVNLAAGGAFQINGTAVLTGSALFTAGNGTAGGPAFSFANDTNTGMYYPATADNLWFATGGVDRLKLDGTGNMDLSTGGGEFRMGGVQTITGTTRLLRAGDGAVGTPTYSFTNDNDTGMYWPNSANSLYFATGGADRLRIDSAGNLNVVTGELQVAGSQVLTTTRLLRAADGAVGTPAFSFLSETNTGLYRSAANVLSVAVNGAERAQVNAAGMLVNGNVNLVGGNFQIGGVNVLTSARLYQGADGSAASPSFAFASEPNTGIFRPAATTWAVSVNSSEKMRIDNNGRMGIGTTNSLSAQLTVVPPGGVTAVRAEGTPAQVLFQVANPATPADASGDSPAMRISAVYDSVPGGGATRTEYNTDLRFMMTSWNPPIGRFGFFVPDTTERMSIMSNTGFVGINNTSPALNLDVGGAYAVSGSTVITSTRTFWSSDGGSNTPAHTFYSEQSLGLYRPSAGVLGFVTGASEKMRMDPNGRLGIGTQSPSVLLHTRIFDANNASVINALRLTHDTSGTGSTGIGTGLVFGGQTSTTADFDMAAIDAVWTDATHASRRSALRFYTVPNAGSLTERMRLTDSGHLGLGTTSPNPDSFSSLNLTLGPAPTANWPSYLDLQGQLTADGLVGAVAFRNTAIAATNNQIGQLKVNREGGDAGSGTMVFMVRPNTAGALTERMRITPLGSVFVGIAASTVAVNATGQPGTTHESNRVAVQPYAQMYGRGFAFSDGTAHQGGVTLGMSLSASDGVNPILSINNAAGSGEILRVYNGATLRAIMNYQGNLGLGAASPQRKLHIADTAGGTLNLLMLENTAAAAANVGTQLDLRSTGVDQAAVRSGWNGAATTDAYLSFFTRGGNTLSEAMRLTSANYMGIGTTSPAVPLAVAGTVGTTHQSNMTAGHAQIYGKGFAYSSDGTAHQGNLTAGLSISVNNSGLAAASLNNAAANPTADSILQLFNGANERVRFLAGGNIGVGTSAPNYAGESATSRVLTLTGTGSATNDVGAIELRNPTATTGYTAGRVNYVLGTVRLASIDAMAVSATDGGELLFNTKPPAGAIAERMRIDRNGYVGIGTSSPAKALQVVGDMRVGTSGTNGCLERFDGTAIAGSCSSDARLKRNVVPFSGALEKLSRLQPVSYEWKSEEFPERRFGTGKSAGLLAQDVEQVMPELVGTDAKGYKTVNYGIELQMMALQAIKELKSANDEQKAQIEALRAELETLKKQ